LFAIAQGNPVRPRQHDPRIEPLLESIIGKGMAVDRCERYQTAEEFDEALAEDARTEERGVEKRALAGPPVETTPGWPLRSETMHGASETGRVRRMISSVTIILIAGGVGVMLAGGGFLIWRHIERSRTAAVLQADADRSRPPPAPPVVQLI